MVTVDIIKEKIEKHIPGSDTVVEDLTGNQNHFGVDVISPMFEGKSVVQQHQMIYEALGKELRGEIHALRIRTSTS